MEREIYTVKKTGSLKNLQRIKDSLTPPKDNEVTVKIRSIGLNFADIFAIMGLYSATPKAPFTPGLEYAGEVISTGENIKSFKPGDKVMGVTRFGAYATALNIDTRYINKLPTSWSYDEGAAFLVQVLTAYYALVPLGALKKNQTVLIHSAAGGVGIQANRIAKKFDAYTIGVVGNKSKLKTLQEEGYNQGIVRSDNFKNDAYKSLDGRELNLVLEATGGKLLKWSYDLLAPMGRLVSYGSAQFTPTSHRPNYFSLAWKYLSRPKIDPLTMITLNKSVMGFNLIWLYEKAELMTELLKDIEELHLPTALIGKVFNFDQLPEALNYFKTGNSVGKIIIKVD